MMLRVPTSHAACNPRASNTKSAACKRVVVVRASSEQETASSNVCAKCGVDKSLAEKGCDGEGRVIGGLGAVPGFGWWPIKAYRPCPKLDAAGIEYTRKGQATNDVLFGGVSLGKEGSVKTLEEMRRTADRGLDINSYSE